jgi:hypothetical protein
VRSDWKGHGLGHVLMARLIQLAGQRGINELVGEVLPENAAMLQLCREFGFTITIPPRDPKLRRVSKTLEVTRPPEPRPAGAGELTTTCQSRAPLRTGLSIPDRLRGSGPNLLDVVGAWLLCALIAAFCEGREITQHVDGGVAQPVVFLEMAGDKSQLRTELARPPPRHPTPDPKSLGFVRSGKHNPATNGNRPAA